MNKKEADSRRWESGQKMEMMKQQETEIWIQREEQGSNRERDKTKGENKREEVRDEDESPM